MAYQTAIHITGHKKFHRRTHRHQPGWSHYLEICYRHMSRKTSYRYLHLQKMVQEAMQSVPPRVSRVEPVRERWNARLKTCTHVYVRRNNRKKWITNILVRIASCIEVTHILRYFCHMEKTTWALIGRKPPGRSRITMNIRIYMLISQVGLHQRSPYQGSSLQHCHP